MSATDTSSEALRGLLRGRIRDVPDYPKPGVMFKDITPLLADAEAFSALVRTHADLARRYDVDKVAGVEARGFILAAAVAVQAGIGFVPVRKAGKLPGARLTESYTLEYATAEIEVQHDAFSAGERVLIVDDVLATGGTLEAALKLVRRAGADVVAVAVLMELTFLDGRGRLEAALAGAPLDTVLTM